MSATQSALADTDKARPGRSRRRLVLAAVLVLALAALAGYVVAFSPLLVARTVVVHGVSGPLADQVRRVAAVDSGTPLIRLDTAAVAARVESIAELSSAQVRTSLPSTVEITVSERVAIGVVRSGSHYVLVDRTGDQYARVDTRPAALPLFVVAHGAGARATGAAVATVAAALAPLPARLRPRILSVEALDPAAITLLLDNGRVVRWGGAERSDAKARILPKLLTQHGTQFDVTDPDRPFSR